MYMQNTKLWMQGNNTYKLETTLEVKELRESEGLWEIVQFARKLESTECKLARKQEIENG